MINALTGLGYGIIGFAVLVGIGLVILGSLASTTAGCGTGYTYQGTGGTQYTTGKCCLNGGADCSSAGNYTNPSTASGHIFTMGGYLGTSSGGLTTWIPVIIVLVIGLLFLGAFLSRKGKQS